jgi:hypothetical protein
VDQITRKGDQLELRFRLHRLQGAGWIEMLLTIAAVGEARLGGKSGDAAWKCRTNGRST